MNIEQVAKSRYIAFISYIIGCIIFCGALELALRGHREGDDSLNPDIYKGLINRLFKFNSKRK